MEEARPTIRLAHFSRGLATLRADGVTVPAMGPLRAGAGDEVDAAALTCPDCGRVFKSSAGIGTHLKLATKSCVRNQKKISQQVRTSPRRASTAHLKRRRRRVFDTPA